MISQKTIDEIKEKASLLELVGEGRTIRRIGSRYVALCPFHNESTPSFYVNEDSNSYHCFGCGVSGNVIAYIMQTRGLSFPDAIEELASRYGITVVRDGKVVESPQRSVKPELYAVNDIAADFFQRSLAAAPPLVKNYVEARGLGTSTLEEFKIGYAPADRTQLLRTLTANGQSEEIQLQAGLIRRNAKGDLYDLFAGRLIFPILVDAKKVAGFGGRQIPGLFDERIESKSPKYLNSPESPIYAKSKILYGFPQALPEAKRSGEVYLVEGYMDVVSLYQAGVTNAVATCGTAFGEGHMRRLSQIAKRVTVLFDGDSAGRSAAAKAFKVFINSPIDVWAVFLEDGEDPDTFAKKHGARTAEALRGLPRVALIDVFVDSLSEKYGGKVLGELGASSKGSIARELSSVLLQVKDQIVLRELVRRASFRLRVKPDHLLSLVTGAAQSSSSQGRPGATSDPLPRPEVQPASESLPPQTPVGKLPRLDQELLHCVMALKEEVPMKVLHEPELCSGIKRATVQFIESLAAIMETNEPDDVKRERIKGLLRDFGPSWVAHWKLTYEMLKDREVNMQKSFHECCLALKKQRLVGLLEEIDTQLGLSLAVGEREALLQERLSLTKRIKAAEL